MIPKFERVLLAGAALVALPATMLRAQGTATATPVAAPAATPAAAASARTRTMTAADLAAWRTIRNPVVSSDGRWFAYVLAPNEGNAHVVLRETGQGGKELRFAIGSVPPPPTGAAAAAAANAPPPLVVSGDGRWAAFTIYPTMEEAKKARAAKKPLVNRLALVNLTTGEKREFDRIRRFAFNDDAAAWLAMQGYAPEAPGAGSAAGAAPGATPGSPAAGAAAPARVESADLVLVGLASGETVNVGNVGEFDFDASGRWLAWTIEARDGLGNGVQVRDLVTGVVRGVESSRALYRRLAWADSALGLAVLRGQPDTVAKDTLYSVLSFTAFGAGAPKKTVFDPAGRADFPQGMKVSADRTPMLSEDLSAVFFGIRPAKKKEARTGRDSTAREPKPSSLVQAGAPGTGGNIAMPRLGADAEDESASLVLWHWKDPRLQSQQIVQEQQDRSYSYLAAFRAAENRFIRLADDSIRDVTLLPHERFAYGADVRAYQQAASYSGRAYADVYVFDLRTGQKRLALRKHPSPLILPAPDGRQALYWGSDGNWWVLDAATGDTRNLTKGIDATFAELEDDHNNLFPPARRVFGWSRDASAVLLSDGWDAWKVPLKGGAAVNLTGDGRSRQVRYQRLYAFDTTRPGARRRTMQNADASLEGVDLGRPLYFGTYGEWTKKGGIARVSPKGGAQSLLWDDASFALVKARRADTFLYTRQTSTEFPDWWVAGPQLAGARRLTDANPEKAQFAWSSGVRLVNYLSDKGDTLQGALYLPANYEPGKQYPLLVTIYERRSQLANTFVQPNATSTPNRTLYTQRGYAVLDPDIAYKVNDPGMSAVWSVLPAVKAAIATGVVDSTHVGLWGHSWGGYQTAFLVTQTNMFRSAIAGAPLTDMVSMYNSIYWNTGGANQAIFESSQGRFKGNVAENTEAYIRNSPVFHAQNVKTPLVILHNDKDGAVDFNQGITYYNTLRQLGKDVILLEYVGENHGLARPVNQKDYAIRMREWFDAWLKGAPPADWMKDGIPRLEMAEHLKQRAAEEAAAAQALVP